MDIIDKIREVMQWTGTTQKDLAKQTGIPYTTLNGYLCGRNQIPVRTLPKIAQGLGVSSSLLLDQTPLPADSMDLRREERDLVGQYRLLTRHQRELVTQTMALFIRQNREAQG